MPPKDKDQTPRASQGFPPAKSDGSPALVGPDDYTRELRRQRAEARPQTALAGNLADLHRLGAQGAATASDPAFATPPGVDASDDDVVSGIEAEGKVGIWNRETERFGLVDAPEAPTPPENTQTDSVDPTSVSPEVQTKGSTTAKAGSTSTTGAVTGAVKR